MRPPSDGFYGRRAARIADRFGHVGSGSSMREALDDAEILRRWQSMVATT
jgi:hypothetical protein